MRRLFIYLLCLLHVLMTTPAAHAEDEVDAYEKAVEQTKKVRDHMRTSFHPLVETSTKNGIATHFSYTMWDHLATRRILQMKAEDGLRRLSLIRREFSENRAKLFEPGTNWDEHASLALARVAHAQSAAIEAEQIVADAATLAESWRGQCAPDKLTRIANYADPKTYWEIKDENQPVAPKPHIEIGVKVTTDTDGNVQSAGGGNEKGETQDPVDALLVVAAAAWTVPPYGWIVSIVCVVLWAIIKIGPYLVAQHKIANLKGEMYDLQQEIREIQLAALDRVSADTPGFVSKKCAELFPEASAAHLNLEAFAKYRDQAVQDLQTISKQGQEILEAYQDRYRNLVQVYLPSVKSGYVNLIETRMAQAQKIEQQIRRMITTRLQPMIENYESVKNQTGFAKWSSQYEIWGATIAADSLFRSSRGFSLVNPEGVTDDTTVNFGNSWNNIGPKLKGIYK